MKKTVIGLSGAAVAGILFYAGAASAAPMLGAGVNGAGIETERLIAEVQYNSRRAIRATPARRGYAGRRGGIGPAGAAAIGLGVLGAAVAVGAASCYRRQAVVNRWGDVIGYRNVYVC